MKYLALLLLALTSFAACRKEQPKLNTAQNACDCINEVSAGFIIEEAYAYGTIFELKTKTDTIFNSRNVIFTASEKQAEYTWYIGSEILDGNSVARYFDATTSGQNISVSLVVMKKPNLKCFPTDDGYDSITKIFHVSSKSDNIDSIFINPNSLFEGVFRMKDKNGTDSVDITIDLYYDPFQGGTMRIYNYDGEGGNSPMNFYGGFEGVNYRQIWYNHNLRANSLQHKSNGEVELNMVNFTNIPSVPSYYYRGRKL